MMHFGFGSTSMFVWMVIQWGLLLLGIYLIVRWINRDRLPKDRENDHAIQILRERYARGEIDDEEYNRMLQRLMKE